eukprot:256214_1
MATPALREDLPSSPLQRGIYSDRSKAPSTLRALFQNKHVLNAMKWGFCSATFITFHTLYHSRGNVPLGLFFGGTTFCLVSPVKFWVYMRRQKWEFHRSMHFAAQNNQTNVLGTGKRGKKIHTREALYDPKEPYSDDEWAFAQKVYRRTFYYAVGGGCIGLVGATSILTLMNASRASPIWMRFGFCTAMIGFGALMGWRIILSSAIDEASKWEKEGRLKQEVKYVFNWMNADKQEEENRPNPNKMKRQKV